MNVLYIILLIFFCLLLPDMYIGKSGGKAKSSK